MKVVIIDTVRESYQAKGVFRTMTVKELRDMLDEFEDDTPIILGFDKGYTFGGITPSSIEEKEIE